MNMFIPGLQISVKCSELGSFLINVWWLMAGSNGCYCVHFPSCHEPVGALRESGGANGQGRCKEAFGTLSPKHVFHELHPSKSFVNLMEETFNLNSMSTNKTLFRRFYLLYFRKRYSLYIMEVNKIQRLIRTYIILLDFVHQIEKMSKIFKTYNFLFLLKYTLQHTLSKYNAPFMFLCKKVLTEVGIFSLYPHCTLSKTQL